MATISALQVRHHHVEHAVITPTNHSCFVCIESDGIVGNFSARQHVLGWGEVAQCGVSTLLWGSGRKLL
jgi:hypothetical protein